MPRITRPAHVRKREAYAQRLRELEVALLAPDLHQKWQSSPAPATTNGQTTARLAKRLPT